MLSSVKDLFIVLLPTPMPKWGRKTIKDIQSVSFHGLQDTQIMVQYD